jgi:hypothetical protein
MCLRICVFKLRNILLLKKIDTFCSHCCAACFGLLFFSSSRFCCGSQRSFCVFFRLYFELSRAHKLALLTYYHRLYWGLTSCCSSQLSSFFFVFQYVYDEDVEYTSCGHIFEIKINIFQCFCFNFSFFLSCFWNFLLPRNGCWKLRSASVVAIKMYWTFIPVSLKFSLFTKLLYFLSFWPRECL